MIKLGLMPDPGGSAEDIENFKPKMSAEDRAIKLKEIGVFLP